MDEGTVFSKKRARSDWELTGPCMWAHLKAHRLKMPADTLFITFGPLEKFLGPLKDKCLM